MSTPSKIMDRLRKWAIFVRRTRIYWFPTVAVLVLAAVPYTADYVRWVMWCRAASAIAPGATKTEVLEVLGEPVASAGAGEIFNRQILVKWAVGADEYKKLSPEQINPPTWTYGRRFTIRDAFMKEPPFFFPFRIRLFGEYSDDVLIEFDQDEVVQRVRMPNDRDFKVYP